jgi:hypothetical protein
MKNIEDAVNRIKTLECPTGDVEKRVAGILENYKVANMNQVSVIRDRRYDRNEAEGYSARLPGGSETLVVIAQSGIDDYVAKVVDAYIQ